MIAMPPIGTVLVGNAARVGLELKDPVTRQRVEAGVTIDVAVTVLDDAGAELDATVSDLSAGLYAIRFLPPEPGVYYVRVVVSGAFDAAGEGRVTVERSRMPAAA